MKIEQINSNTLSPEGMVYLQTIGLKDGTLIREFYSLEQKIAVFTVLPYNIQITFDESDVLDLRTVLDNYFQLFYKIQSGEFKV